MQYEFSESIQRGIIYLLIHDEEFYAQIIHLVKPEYFEFPVHSKLFSITTDFYTKYNKLPTRDILLQEAKDNLLPKETFEDYDDELYRIETIREDSLEHKDYILEQIEKFARQASVKQAIAESITLLKENRFAEIETKIRESLAVSRHIDVGHLYFDDLDERLEDLLKTDNIEYFSPCFPSISDALDGGLQRKEMAMVVAFSGGGKSVYLVNQSVQFLIDNYKVLYVTLEMSQYRIARRFDSVMSLIPQNQLKDEYQLLKERLAMFKENFENSNLVIREFPTKRANVNHIRALLDQLKLHHDFVPDVIVVDYLELLNPNTEINQEYLAQQRIAEELRGLAIEKNCLVFTATQSNREGRKAKTITDMEIGDSFGKIRPVDFVMSLNQTEEEFDKGFMRAFVIKSRNGKTRFSVPVKVNYNTLRMEELKANGDSN